MIDAAPRVRIPIEILDASLAERLVIQDFCPLAKSIDWELGNLYWKEHGHDAFINDNIPFIINNDGRLSTNAAEVLFASLIAAETAESLEPEIFVLELGVGTGLFARLFLDVFRKICTERGRNYYERLCYVATDRSEQMLADIARRAILSDHSGRYHLKVVDALHVKNDLSTYIYEIQPSSGSFRAVFLNYVLDTLPATVVQVEGNLVSELCLRTSLARGIKLSEYTSLSAEDLIQCATSRNPADKRKLIDLYRLFMLEYEYRLVESNQLPYGDLVVRFAHNNTQVVLHNYGAITCIEQLMDIQHKEGFILINDYGFPHPEYSVDTYAHQRFAGSAAIGLNFPLLQSYVEGPGTCNWIQPLEDNDHIHTRLLGKRMAPETVSQFHQQFSKSAFDWLTQSAEQARSYLKCGNNEAAMSAYREALKRQPNNWALIGEIANLLTYTFRDYTAGIEMAKAALKLNPLYIDLWNCIGDSLFYLGRTDEAHNAFLRALALNPGEVRARLNLVYTFSTRNDLASALNMVADGLYFDKTGEYRDRFLEKQAEIINRLTQRNHQQEKIFANRFNKAVFSSSF